MTERTVYVVNGSKGDYSDRTDWIVGVFETREEADAWERAATKWVKDAKDWLKTTDDDHYYFHWASPFDPRDPNAEEQICMGYYEPSYWVTENVMGRALPDAKFEAPKRRKP